ncbi:MAG: MBL fold metallo-hydrolase [Methanosarcinaceae archaeon]|jgi:ribonuclease BN (tRNA processing enzyme)|nr:MBL fold metallo-hydrolase [Methanosarcinaceae archaeon]NKQ38437.1 MBL fold metallo-hydrolase [Methanosarcinales archaeon]
MKFTFLGTGCGIPQKNRIQSGILFENKSSIILFDCGCGILNRIHEFGYNHLKIDAIILSHLHLDHVADTICLIKANMLMHKKNLTLYGPKGTKKWILSILDIYQYMRDNVDINVVELNHGDIFTPIGTDFEIECASAVHSTPTLGYKVMQDGKSVVYSSDTEPCSAIMDLANGANVLIHECSFPLGFETTNHTNPNMLSDYIRKNKIDVKKIYLTHLYPHMQGHEKEATSHIKKYFNGNVEIAFDGLVCNVV